MLRLAVLHPSDEGSASPFRGLDPAADVARHLPGHDVTDVWVRKPTATRQAAEVAAAGYDVAVNLCDGAWGEDRPGIEVVLTLERAGMAFTGAGSSFYEPSREAMKMAAHAGGVAVPGYVVVKGDGGADRALDELAFPMIVKPPEGYSSIGLHPGSRVTDAAALRREVERTRAAFGGALVEEFVYGLECTVLVTEPPGGGGEPWALLPLEYRFPAGESFQHFDLKWRRFDTMRIAPVTDPGLDGELRRAAAATFAGLGGSGYARCDFRVDAAGTVHFLEINPNCGIFYPEGAFGGADLVLAADPVGHTRFLEHLLHCAQRRRDRTRPAWEVRFDRRRGFGLVTTRPVPAGATVVAYEEQPQALVSLRHVARHWDPQRRLWLQEYGWPVSDSVMAMWSADPAGWRPINHSCDPSAWLDGLDLVARRDLAAGEAITMDYVTMGGPGMASFACTCGSVACRGTVSADTLPPAEVMARYAGHTTDAVAARWAAGGGTARWAADVGATAGAPFTVAASGASSGLVSTRMLAPGELVAGLRWEHVRPEPDRWTIQVGAGAHAMPLPEDLRYLNHSCDPTVVVDVDEGAVRVRRPVAPGDELTYFYPDTEWRLAEPFDCTCGAPACLGRVTGAADLPPEVLAGHHPSSTVRRLAADPRHGEGAPAPAGP